MTNEKWIYTIHRWLNTLCVNKLLFSDSRFHCAWSISLIQLIRWINLILKSKQKKRQYVTCGAHVSVSMDLYNGISTEKSYEFSYIYLFSAKSWLNSASIDIQWVATTECQCWQNSARIWQKITKYRKTRLSVLY